jgi:hypothetical protein
MITKRSLYLLFSSLFALQLWAAEPPSVGASSSPDPSTAGTAVAGSSEPSVSATVNPADLKELRERIAKQEEEIKRLQQSVEEQRALLEKAVQNSSATGSANLVNTTARTTDGVKIAPAVDAVHPKIALQHPETAPPSPLSISIGNTKFSPLGFVDATFFGRSTNVGSGIGTNFSSIPYNTTANYHLSEMNFSTQNSRLGMRVDSNVLGSKVLGYFEADFLGAQPTNVFVSSNSDSFRMRNVFVDVEKNGFEILGGQDWSFATPNRKGLSPLPSDIFYTQVMDTNYQVGLVWSRQTQFRFIGHPTENFAYGVSLENPQQYIGGSAGGPTVTLPAAFATTLGTQFDNGTTSYASPNLTPDIIFKGAYDGHVGNDQTMHIEAVGMIRNFKDSLPFGTPATFRSSTATAGAGEVNGNFEVAKGFRLIANTFFGSGNGRYVFGQAPDVVIRANGSISPVHTYSTVDGFEAQVAKNTLLYGYYGGMYVGRNVAVDTNGKLIGYGYNGSSNSQNRTVQEGSFGIIQTFWKNPNYGALSLITQYSYLWRNPWYVAPGTAKSTHTNMYYVDLRYTLP